MQKYFYLLLWIIALLSLVTCQESTLSLQGLKKIQISSEISGAAIGVGSSPEIAKDEVLILVAGGNLATVTQHKAGDTLKITISEDGALSSSATQSKPHLSSIFTILLVTCSFFLTKYRWLAISMIVLVYCTARAVSTNTHQVDITILFSPGQELDSLKIISSGSMLVAPNLFSQFNHLQCGSSSKDLQKCASMFCNSELTSDCLSRLYDDNLVIGILVSATGDHELLAKEFTTAMELAVDKYGPEYPRIQFVYADTQSDPIKTLQEAKEMYDYGIRLFIGPILGDEVKELLQWSKSLKEDTFFLSPTASNNFLNSYSNFVSLSPSNNDTAVVYCGYLDYHYAHELSELLIVHVDDDYGNDLAQSIMEKCTQTNYNVRVVSTYSPSSIQSAVDASVILRTLDCSISATEKSAALFISYSEIQHFLESAAQTDLGTQIYWYGTNFGLNEHIISSPTLLSAARKVQLRSIQYAGSEIDITSNIRRNFLKDLRNRVGTASPLAAQAYDAVMLYYISSRGEKASVSTLANWLRHSAESAYGLTGWLELDHSFRKNGEYHSSFVPSSPSMLNFTWNQDLALIYEELDVPAMPYRLDFLDITGHEIAIESFEGCDYFEFSVLYETATAHEVYAYFSQQDLVNGLICNNNFIIPSFSNTTMWNVCNNKVGITFCAANAYATASTCFESKREIVGNKRNELIVPQTIDQALFQSDAALSAPTDNMFTSFDGAQGTSLDNQNTNPRPMNLSLSFP